MASMQAELVFVPAPGVGHIISTMEIAKLLVQRDQRLSVTVLIIKPLADNGVTAFIESLAKKGLDRIRFLELPQVKNLPKPDPKAPSISFFKDFIDSQCKSTRNIVADMISKQGSSRVAGVVIDMFCDAMIEVANEFNIPTYTFFTSNAAFLGYKLYIQSLCQDQHQDVIELINSDTEVPVPSFVKPVPTKVFPLLFESKDGFSLFVSSARNLREVKGIMVNTFLELETHAIESLSADGSIPPVYPVGPLLNLDGGMGKSKDEKSDNDVINWLDGQPPSSVVFLCFGSMGSFDEVQVKEIAYALERSGRRFLWSLRRPPPPDGMVKLPGDYEDPGKVLPEGFLERNAGTGKVIGWAPQVAVLSHRAVGGFVSHCGWNSMLESLWFGVPTATWPMYAEQNINAFEMVVELGLAVDIKLDYKKGLFNQEGSTIVVTAEEIERGIRLLMDDSESEVRKKVKETSGKSKAAIAEGGSSYNSLGNLIEAITSNIS